MIAARSEVDAGTEINGETIDAYANWHFNEDNAVIQVKMGDTVLDEQTDLAENHNYWLIGEQWVDIEDANGTPKAPNQAQPNLVALSDIDFGNAFINQMDSVAISLINNGLAELVVTDLNWNLSAFAVSDTAFVISAGSDTSVTVYFAPAAVQAYADTLTIVSNDVDHPEMTVLLSGNGILSPEEITLRINEFAGSGYYGNYQKEYVEIYNYGTEAVDLADITLTYTDGSLNLSGTLAARTYYLVAARTEGTAGSDINGESIDAYADWSFNESGAEIRLEYLGEAIDEQTNLAENHNYWLVNGEWEDIGTTNGTPKLSNVWLPNTAPERIAQIADQQLSEDSEWLAVADLDTIFYDIDYLPLVYSAEADTSGLELDISGSELQIRPVEDWFGAAQVVVTVTDDSLATAADTFAVTVFNVNDEPMASGILPETAVILENSPLFLPGLSVIFTDADGEDLQISVSDSSCLQFGAMVTYLPPAGWSGIDTLSFMAVDSSEAVATDSIIITVLELVTQDTLEQEEGSFGMAEDETGQTVVNVSVPPMPAGQYLLSAFDSNGQPPVIVVFNAENQPVDTLETDGLGFVEIPESDSLIYRMVRRQSSSAQFAGLNLTLPANLPQLQSYVAQSDSLNFDEAEGATDIFDLYRYYSANGYPIRIDMRPITTLSSK